MKSLIKKILNKPFFMKIFNCLHIKSKGLKSNEFKINSLVRGKCTIDIFNNSKNNEISIADNVLINNLTFKIFGSNNKIVIEKDCYINNLTVWIEDDNNTIFIGKNIQFCGRIKLSCIEGTNITIGDNCLFSDEIDIRTGDGHAIIDENGVRNNLSKDIVIGNHIWIGQKVSMFKGTIVNDNSVIAANAVLTKDYKDKGVVLAGVPAKIVKRDINWNFDRNFGGYNNN